MTVTWATLAKPIFGRLTPGGRGCLLRVSQGVSGVRQCPGRDLILSLRLIYCARHAPHGPTGVQAFCPTTSLIFAYSTFCTVVAVQVQHQLPKICSKKTESRMTEQSPSPRIFWLIILHRFKICSKKPLTNLIHILQKTSTIFSRNLDPHS